MQCTPVLADSNQVVVQSWLDTPSRSNPNPLVGSTPVRPNSFAYKALNAESGSCTPLLK